MPQCMDIYNEYFLVNHMKKNHYEIIIVVGYIWI